ncbi:glucose dehydrogenase [FAD, quinone] [Fopius arisanus]|uniref:Glucose dehydrogenase [FAD, quinone] n=1 Tax=Fopius arisanus TaxID=64838 RepID=A0A9R1TXM6_9HYME|nr:PREDICTED: glucose dehydrogenase [FAD, quinone]-like [Fopius arisanus]
MVALAKSIAFIIFPILVFLCSQFLEISYYLNDYVDSVLNKIHQEKVYNFIIVGAGTAGSIIAAKLIDAGEKVLLVEAGGPPPPFVNIPVLSPMLQQTPYDWHLRTIPQVHACKGLIDNVKGLSLNFEIRQFVISSFIKKLITGLIISERTIVAMENGARWSTDKLLTPERLSKGLDVITHAQVEKINFDSNNKAHSILLKKHDRKYVIRATDGIVVSAGAIGTPKLLMLSGIGPKIHLKGLSIDVINDLPVGKNLIDHVLTGIDLVILNTSLSVSVTQMLKPSSALNYFLFGEGPWTFPGLEVVGTLYADSMKNLTKYPDIQLMVMPVGISHDNGATLRKYLGISDTIFSQYFAALTQKTAVTLAPVLLHPKSTGEVKLKSRNPDDHPLIDPNYLSQEEDVNTLIDGLKFVEELVNTRSMKTLGAEMNRQPFPGCEIYRFGSHKYWECYIRHLTLTSYHPAGTCSIGKVVDKNFRVYNTQNLYIADTSVIPRLPSGNINAVVMKLAYKAAKIIIESKQKKSVLRDQCHLDDFIQFIFFSRNR